MTRSPFLIPSFLRPLAALETFWCNCLYDIFWVFFGSSPTQIIAVLSFLSFKCLSIQFADAFNVPSSNHFILTSSLLYFTSLIFLYGLIQVILFPSFFQNALLFFMDSLYLFWYWDLLARLFLIHSCFVLKINSDEVFFWFFSIIFFLFTIFLFLGLFLLLVFLFFKFFLLTFFLLFLVGLFFWFGFFLFFCHKNYLLNLTHLI